MRYFVSYELDVKPQPVTVEIECSSKESQDEVFFQRLQNSNLKDVRRTESDV